MIVTVASGKGGTGKTMVAVNAALALRNVQFLDCDVEEPNAHLFLKPLFKKTEPVSIPVPEVDPAICTRCGRCSEVCAYNAIAVIKDTEQKKGNVLVFSNLCHGCGSCSALCPQGAIQEVNKTIGIVQSGRAGTIQFMHGLLTIGEAMSPPIIRAIKKKIDPSKTVIIDSPPGTSCPVITAVKGSDFCILVTEPTPFGLHDLHEAVQVVQKLGIPCGVVINRADLGDARTEDYCHDQGIPVLMRIPFSKRIARAYSKGKSIFGVMPKLKKTFKELFKRLNTIQERSLP
ncbi:MAG: 4Fe-4S dicluster domain-containing protein [Elusimicrobia bacterium]|nr:4Fe-4S dicluster domain-containing protein [Elusimicrobiota bacterium]MBD3412658.1 4Fe-4S dicluster domain-containing protein [Elusimicrobiota bacterium]